MIANDIIKPLQAGELANLSIGENSETLLNFLQQGMLELYKRFRLKTKEFIIDCIPSQTEYDLPSDCLLIEDVYDETGEKLPINNETNYNGIFTVSPTQIQIPNPREGRQIAILYIASPTPITSLDQNVEINPSFQEALTQYILYRAYGTISPDQDNNIYYRRFEAACQKIEQYGLLGDEYLDQELFRRKGFV